MPRTARSPRRPARRAASSGPWTPEDLRRLVFVGDPRIAPDGTRVIFVHKHADTPGAYRTTLWSVPAGGGAPTPFTHGPRDAMPRWSPDGTRLAFVRAETKGRPQIHLVPADGGEARPLTDLPPGSIRDLAFAPDGRTLLFSFRAEDPERTADAAKAREASGASEPPLAFEEPWYRLDGDGYFGERRFALHACDVETGTHRPVWTRDRLGDFTYDVAPDGRRVVLATNVHKRALFEPWRTDLVVLDLATGKARTVPGLPRGPKSNPRWSPDGRTIAYAGREGTDGSYSVENLELWTCDAQRGGARSLTGAVDVCLLAATLSDVAEASFAPWLAWTPDGKRLLFRLGAHGESHLASVPARGGPIELHSRGAVDLSFGTLSGDGRLIACVRSVATAPPEIAVGRLSRTGVSLRTVTAFNRDLVAARRTADIEPFRSRAEDGHETHGWIMRPPHLPKTKRTPAILEIHGGPHAQYGVGFFHEFQCLAARGWTVVFTNPRGSKGYGRDHCAAIRGRWGDRDWADVQGVLAFMQARRTLDRKRLGVMGGSYGGYMTNWAIGHSNDFRAAITDRCVSNLVSMAGNSDYIDLPDEYFPGNWWDRPEERWAQSPIRAIGDCRTPTLIIHSEGDLRCNIEQAEQVFAALQVLKVPTRFVRYPRSTSHGMSRGGPPDLRIHRLHEILAWWERWL